MTTINWNNVFKENFFELSDYEMSAYNALDNRDISFFENLQESNHNSFEEFIELSSNKHQDLLVSLITSANISVFESCNNELVRGISYDFYARRESELVGILNIEDLSISLEDKTIKISMNDKTPSINPDLIDSITIAKMLNMVELPVIVELCDSPIIKNTSKRNLVSSTLLASSLLFSISAFAGANEENINNSYDSGDMVDHTFNAVKEMPQVKQMIKEKKDIVNRKVKEFAESIEYKEVAGVVGFIAKAGLDQKISHKGKIDSRKMGLEDLELGNINYSLEVKMNGLVRGSVGGKNPFIKDSSYELNTEVGKNTKVQFDVRIAFD